MTTLKQSLAIDGQAISNLDPELVITLDAHPSVQISNKTESTITYSFIGAVTKDATYTLNLTFVYKGIHKLVMPLTFEQTVNDPILKVTNIPKSVKIWDEGSDIPFTVFYGPEPGEDITESISDVVITTNDYVESKGGSNWRIKGARESAVVNNETDYAFNVTHGDDTFAIKAKAAFTIAQWNGIEFEVNMIPTQPQLECTVGMETKFYFKPTYRGKFAPGTILDPTVNANRRGFTVVRQEDDLEKELLVVTVKGTAAMMQANNQFVFNYTPPGGSKQQTVPWWMVDVYAAEISYLRVTPTRTDTKQGEIYKVTFSDVRLGHEKVDLDDPRITVTGSHASNYPILSVEGNDVWYKNNNSGGFINTTTTLSSPGYASKTAMIPMYTVAGEVLANNLKAANISENKPAQHNVQTFTIIDTGANGEQPVPGLTLVGRPTLVYNGLKPVIKLYDDFSISDAPNPASASFSMDNGHSGDNLTMTAMFRDGTGKNWSMRGAVFQIPKSPMLMSQVVPGPIDAPNTDQQVINMKVEQLQFDKQLVQLDNVLFGGMSVSGEASAIGTITSKGDGTYLIPITPTGKSGDAVIKGQITYEGVAYAFTSTITFKDVADVKIVDKPLNVKVFDVGSDVPFTVMVDGVDKTQEITNLKFTPTANVIAYNDLGAWEIWDAPNAGVTEKVKYTFDLLVEGETKSMTFDGSFVIGAWDGAFLKVKNLSPYIGVSATGTKTTYTELEVTYRNKPAADKIQYYSGKPGDMGIRALEPSEDNKTVRVPMYYSKIAGYSKSTVTLQWRYKGTTGTVVGRDIATGGAQDLYVTDDNLYGWNVAGNIQGNVGALVYSAPNLAENPQIPMIFANGEKIPNDSPDLEHWLSPGADTTICASFLGVVNDRFVYKITAPRPSSGSIHNLVRLRLKSNNRYTFAPIAPEGNFRSYPFAGTVDMKLAVVPQEPIVPAKKNIVPVKLVAANQGVPATPTVYMTGVYKNPSNGNVVIDGEPLTFENTTDPTVQTLTISTGHTGDKVNLRGIVNTVSGLYELNHDLTIGKSEITAEPWQEAYSAKADTPVDIVFDLNMMHYNQVEADLSQIVFKTINVTGNGNGTTLPVNVTANTFKTPITIPGLAGTVSITGTFTEKDVPSIEYGFAFTVNTTQEVDITTESRTLDVKVWDFNNTVPFVVKADGEDVTSSITVIGFTQTANVKADDVGPAPDKWYIYSETPLAATKQTVTYQYRLSGEPESVVREATGEFNIAEYDGTEMWLEHADLVGNKAEFPDVFYDTMTTAATASRSHDMYINVYYRGRKNSKTMADNGTVAGPNLSFHAGNPSLSAPGVPFKVPFYSTQDWYGVSTIVVYTKIYGVNNPVNNKQSAAIVMPVSLWSVNVNAYNIINPPAPFSGKLNDIIEVDTLAMYRGFKIDWGNPVHVFSDPSNKGIVELVPGSGNGTKFKLKIVKDVDVDTQQVFNIKMTDPGNAARFGQISIIINQKPFFTQLELAEGFITAIEGDSRNTVTVKQSTILPTE